MFYFRGSQLLDFGVYQSTNRILSVCSRNDENRFRPFPTSTYSQASLDTRARVTCVRVNVFPIFPPQHRKMAWTDSIYKMEEPKCNDVCQEEHIWASETKYLHVKLTELHSTSRMSRLFITFFLIFNNYYINVFK